MSSFSLAKRTGFAVACLIAAVSTGCGSTLAGSHGTSSGGLTISHLQAVESPSNVLAYDVSWKTSRAADTSLDVECTGLDPWTLSDATEATSHHVFVMGLLTGASCTFTARAKSADGGAASDYAKAKVSDLPDYLPSIHLTVEAKAGTLAPGWTLINLSNEVTKVPYIAALIDSEGRFRWYYQYPGLAPGSDTPVTEYGKGILIGGRDVPMSEVDWQGNRLWADESGEYFHHEVRPAETPGRFYSLSNVQCASQANYSDDIVEYDSVAKKERLDVEDVRPLHASPRRTRLVASEHGRAVPRSQFPADLVARPELAAQDRPHHRRCGVDHGLPRRSRGRLPRRFRHQ